MLTFWAEYLWAVQHNEMAQKGRDSAGSENSQFRKFGHYFCPRANLIRLHTILQIRNGLDQCNGESHVFHRKSRLVRRDLFALNSLEDGVFLAQLVAATCSFQGSVKNTRILTFFSESGRGQGLWISGWWNKTEAWETESLLKAISIFSQS